jgi:hypothetical protein
VAGIVRKLDGLAKYRAGLRDSPGLKRSRTSGAGKSPVPIQDLGNFPLTQKATIVIATDLSALVGLMLEARGAFMAESLSGKESGIRRRHMIQDQCHPLLMTLSGLLL